MISPRLLGCASAFSRISLRSWSKLSATASPSESRSSKRSGNPKQERRPADQKGTSSSASKNAAAAGRSNGSKATSKPQSRQPPSQPRVEKDPSKSPAKDTPGQGGKAYKRPQTPPREVTAAATIDTQIGAVAATMQGVATVVLKSGKARLFLRGSPKVYSGAVDCIVGRPPPQAGDSVVVANSSRVPIAWGVYNPMSMFQVRILQREDEVEGHTDCVLNVERLVQQRIAAATKLRAVLGLPSAATNAYRLVNSEGDRLSGLVVDVLGSVVVVQSWAAWTERYRQVITAAIEASTGLHDIVWRPATETLKEEGIGGEAAEDEGEEADVSGASGAMVVSGLAPGPSQADTLAAATSGRAAAATSVANPTMMSASSPRSETADETVVGSSSPASPPTLGLGEGVDEAAGRRVQMREHGLLFWASPLGQKTGYYADQRDSRAFVAGRANGRTLLDLCCYSGGFAVQAAAAGAREVTGVDSSAPAIELAAANAEANGVAACCRFVRADIAYFMRDAVQSGNTYDLVVLDPPKLAPTKRVLARATAKYQKLNALAMQLVAPGGLLMTCSCSAAMTQSGGFLEMVQAAAREAGRSLLLLRTAGASPDHPQDPAYPEGEYLTNMTFVVL